MRLTTGSELAALDRPFSLRYPCPSSSSCIYAFSARSKAPSSRGRSRLTPPAEAGGAPSSSTEVSSSCAQLLSHHVCHALRTRALAGPTRCVRLLRAADDERAHHVVSLRCCWRWSEHACRAHVEARAELASKCSVDARVRSTVARRGAQVTLRRRWDGRDGARTATLDAGTELAIRALSAWAPSARVTSASWIRRLCSSVHGVACMRSVDAGVALVSMRLNGAKLASVAPDRARIRPNGPSASPDRARSQCRRYASNLTPKFRSGANPMIQRQQEYQAKSGYVHTRRPGYSTYFRACCCRQAAQSESAQLS